MVDGSGVVASAELTSPPRRPWTRSVALAATVVSVGLAALLLYDRLTNPLSLYGSAYPIGTPTPALRGTGENGRPLALADLKGKTVAVFFGFLHCPNYCPTTLAALERVRQALPERQRSQFVTLLVSVDPKRDTPALMNEYVTYFSASARGLIIPEAQLRQAAEGWGVGYQYVDVKGENYQVNHTTGTYLVDRAGNRRVVWDYTQLTTNPQRVAQDVQAVME
ncbi:SCO family protein [Deinococcus aquaticus]|uniref:SCO family protein n=1 Tax=Deinococcus aquaticus TaxID=328692 RepID=UPI003F48BF37